MEEIIKVKLLHCFLLAKTMYPLAPNFNIEDHTSRGLIVFSQLVRLSPNIEIGGAGAAR